MPLKTKKENVEAILNIGRHALKKSDYETALQYFTRAYELDPDNQIAAYFTKKLQYRLQNDMDVPLEIP